MRKCIVLNICGALTLLFAVATLFCSCDSAVFMRPSHRPVDISRLMDEYARHDDLKEDDVMDIEYMALVADNSDEEPEDMQGLCTTKEWWFVHPNRLTGSDDAKRLVKLYNYCSLNNAIGADYEIVLRALMTGDESMVQAKAVANAIWTMDMGPLASSPAANDFREELAWAVGNYGSWTEENSPNASFMKFSDIIFELDSECNVDTVELAGYFQEVSSVIEKYSHVQEQIASLDEEVRFGEVLKHVSEAQTFEEQCGIVLACSSHNETFADVWSLKLMRQLLESGRYSLLLDRMWIIWRTLSQTTLCGTSRDSIIPNYSYEKMRKKVFATLIGQMSKEPSDKMIRVQALVLCSYSHLIRNGSFIYGNDAALYMHYYCPDFYKSSLGE